MKQVTHTQAFLRKRKILLVLPLLGLPFITLVFWALGGGKIVKDVFSAGNQGLNLQLPGSRLTEDSTMNKLAFYEKSQSDSQKRADWKRSDPFYRELDTSLTWNTEGKLESSIVPISRHSGYNPVPLNPSPYDGAVTNSEEKVMQKLAQLNEAIQNTEHTANVKEQEMTKRTGQDIGNSGFGGDIDRLESMMQSVSSKEDEDPELKQLSGMMDKILDIQHPERVKEHTKAVSSQHKESIYPVQVEQPTISISLLGDTVKRMPGGYKPCFYGLEENQQQSGVQTSVLASVHGTQTLTSGSVAKLRLDQNIYVGGELISKGSFIYGTAEMNGERLHISISTIRSGITILPVKLQVYDLDGIEGIYMPGSVQREVVKSSTDNALQGLELSTIDPSLRAQAASAGISAAKKLLSRKVKIEAVTLKGGYQVILQSM